MIGKAAPRSISIEGIKGTPPEVWMSDNQALWWWYCYREMDKAIPSHSKNHVRRIIFDDLLPKWYNHPDTPAFFTKAAEMVDEALQDCQRWKSRLTVD